MDGSESPSVEQVVQRLNDQADAFHDAAVAERQRYGLEGEDAGLRASHLRHCEESERFFRALATSYPLQQAELGRLREDAARLDRLEALGQFSVREGADGNEWAICREGYTSEHVPLGVGIDLRRAIDALPAAISWEER